MSNDHDPQMQDWLLSDIPPEHGSGFWDEVRADLDDDTVGTVVPLERSRRHIPWLLVAAAAVVVATVADFGVLRDRGDDVDVTTEPGIGEREPDTTDRAPDSNPDSTPDTALEGDLGPVVAVGDPTERGSGRVIAVSPDGRWLYVADDAGDDETGCEGAPRFALYVEPIDGGERRLVAPVADLDATTVSSLAFDGQSRIATVVQCEGFESRIVTGDVGEDGTMNNIEELTLPEPECHDGVVDGVYDLAYVGPGHLLAATATWADGLEPCLRLYSLSDAAEPTVVGPDEVTLVEATADGSVITATARGEVAVDGRVVLDLDGVAGLSVSPLGRTFAVSGLDESHQGPDDVVVPIGGGEPAPFATDAYEITLVDDKNGIMTAEVNGERMVAAFRAGEPDASTPLVTGDVLGFVVAPSGDRVFVTVTDDTGENARILEVALTR